MTRHNYTALITTLITILVLIALISQIRIDDIKRTLRNIKPLYFLLSLFFYIVSYLLLAIKWKVLIRSSTIRFRKLFLISAVHNFFNNLLPAKTGELYFFYAVKKYGNISLGEGIAALFIARIFDLLSLFLLFLFAVAILGIDRFRDTSHILIAVVFTFIVPLVLAGSFLIFGSTIFDFIESCLLKFFNSNRFPSVLSLSKKGRNIVEHIQSIHQRNIYIQLMMISLITLLTRFVLFYIAIKGFGCQLDFFSSIISSTIAFLAMILPIQSLAGLGTTQAGWAIGLSAVGITWQDSIVLGFGLHMCILIFMFLVGGLAYLCLIRKDIGLAWKNIILRDK